ncbi:glycosyltransferase [Mumia zhuanghuii]|uniref:Bifunctional polysaccharide deacetylase/glycosyltransferase family 2 protein n=2 Tax=Mumia TaxID=1546255 RepID=A0ABW1QQ04_9ACTN|nr:MULTISPECIES: bifunctional polysaccharide deacetylase/glycosyltransferase family 2 protein [Mumia]KAA1420441.1 glycosyltransferase [Mumia zhuanghuii]
MTSGTPRHRTVRDIRPRAHWVLLAVLLPTLAAALLVQGYARHMFGSTPDGAVTGSGSSDGVPAEVVEGGPVVDARGDTVRTLSPGPRSVALTFDDGPDPRWTPEILDVLKEHGVHATFFVVGTQVADHPRLTRRILDEGHEIGMHTFSHAELDAVPAWRRSLELRESQLVLNGATGTTSALLRPPYSSTNDAVDDGQWAVLREVSGDGYVAVLSTLDSQDWRRPGVDAIVANSTPEGDAGEVLLLHDAGGDRSQTVAALDELLPQLKTDGVTVGSVGETTGLTGTAGAASPVQTWQGRALLFAFGASTWILRILSVALLAAGVLAVGRSLLLVVAARRHRRRSVDRWGPVPTPAECPPVTVVVPAFNESAGIEAAVRSLVASDVAVEVIVVDDGSTDDTAAVVERMALPGVRLIRQPNAGKPAALNTGIAAASHEIIVMVDGDTVFEPATIRHLVLPFRDPEIGAVSGNAKVANRGGLLGRWQHIEYVVGFNLDRRLFDLAECMPTVPGAIGAFRRSALVAVGGVSDATLAEDTDLTMALLRDGWRVVYQEEARAWTEAPATLGALWRQRYRWCYGTLQAMWKHRGAYTQGGRAGRFGRRGLTYLMLFQVLLPLLAPVVDVFAIYGLIFLDPPRVIGLWLAFLGLQLATSVYAFRLDGERLAPLWTLALQQVVYRQLMYLVVIQSVWTSLAGVRLRWQRMERYGSLRAPTAPAGDDPPAGERPAPVTASSFASAGAGDDPR